MAAQIEQTPLSNDSTTGDGLNTLGYRYNLPNSENREQFGFRLDYILSDAHSFEGIYRHNDFDNDRPDFLSGFNETFSQTLATPDFFSTAWHWTAGPNLINEVRFGANLAGVVFTDERDFLQALLKIVGQGRHEAVEDGVKALSLVVEKHKGRT